MDPIPFVHLVALIKGFFVRTDRRNRVKADGFACVFARDDEAAR
jgi:hypothetical protein